MNFKSFLCCAIAAFFMLVRGQTPTGQPSRQPTGQPSRQPTRQPTGQPSRQPSSQPSSKPTNPTSQPSSKPTNPTSQPSSKPSRQPTRQPSGQPSRAPTGQPTSQPSSNPTSPTSQPSGHPTLRPSTQPSTKPSATPTLKCQGIMVGDELQAFIDTNTIVGEEGRTQPMDIRDVLKDLSLLKNHTKLNNTRDYNGGDDPLYKTYYTYLTNYDKVVVDLFEGRCKPSSQPSSRPTEPSGQPSSQPTRIPTAQPSGYPSCKPTSQPSRQPSRQPTTQPTGQPSRQPSSQPSRQPTRQPTGQPSRQPSSRPTTIPSSHPSMQPSSQPTSDPSTQPTFQPTGQPSSQPTFPTPYPSFAPGNPVYRGYVVKIREPRYSPKIINLNEIQLFLNDVQLLVSNKTCNTSISTPMPGAPLHLCFDGDVESSYCSTGGESGIRAKITVDTKMKAFDRIVVHNRKDCCQDYILGATIEVENYMHEVVYSAVFDAVRDVYTFYSPIEVTSEPNLNISALLHTCLALLWVGLAACYAAYQRLFRRSIDAADETSQTCFKEAFYFEKHSGFPSEGRATEIVASYALGVLPAACEDGSLWRRLRTEFLRSHKYFAAVWPAVTAVTGKGGDGEDLASGCAAIWACVRSCMHSSMLFFFVAVLYSTVAPADDGSCTLMSNSTESVCLARKLPLHLEPLAPAASYCLWRHHGENETYFGSACLYNAQVFNENNTIIVGLVVGVLATLAGMLMEQLFALAASPARVPAATGGVLPAPGDAEEPKEAVAIESLKRDTTRRLGRRVLALQVVARLAMRRYRRGVARRTALQALSQAKTKQFIYEENKAGEVADSAEQVRGAEVPVGRQRLRLWAQPRKVAPVGDLDFDGMCEDMYYQRQTFLSLAPDKLVAFDEEWRIDSQWRGGLMDRSVRFKSNVRQRLLALLRSVRDECAARAEGLQRTSPEYAGVKIMQNYIVDVLGRGSVESRLLQRKMDRDFPYPAYISALSKHLAMALIVLVTAASAYYALLLSSGRSNSWQMSFLGGCLGQLFLEMIFIDTVDCLLLDFVVPHLLRDELHGSTSSSGASLLKQEVLLAVSLQPYDSLLVFNAPSFFHPSQIMSRRLPDRFESVLAGAVNACTLHPSVRETSWAPNRSSSKDSSTILRRALLWAGGELPFSLQRAASRLAQYALWAPSFLLMARALRAFWPMREVVAALIACFYLLLLFGTAVAAGERHKRSTRRRGIAPAPMAEDV